MKTQIRQNQSEEEIEKKFQKREKRKRKLMKVSGAGVKGLQRIISGK